MKYINAKNKNPENNVDVHVVTFDGKRGIAKFWEDTGMWLTQDDRLNTSDKVAKWKYEEAKME
tara:strand:+ start:910 stop:1098 length:189 start_codon:yes stop_codon:yes gene_type:complete